MWELLEYSYYDNVIYFELPINNIREGRNKIESRQKGRVEEGKRKIRRFYTTLNAFIFSIDWEYQFLGIRGSKPYFFAKRTKKLRCPSVESNNPGLFFNKTTIKPINLEK